MMKLDSGNVLLKPSHRKQVMTGLKRALKLGQRIGQFAMTITMHRIGRAVEVHVRVQDSAGSFSYRARKGDWRTALRETARGLYSRLHQQQLMLAK